MRKEIEQLYIQAIYNDEAPNVFTNKVLDLIGIDNEKQTRTNLQQRSRWKYLQMVANQLNSQGQTYRPIGTDYEMKWTKDLLYEIYWQSSRSIMYPEKNRQLNTKEFCDLADHVVYLINHIFQISIPFPDKSNLIDREKLV